MSKIRVSEAWIGPDKDHMEHSLCFEINCVEIPRDEGFDIRRIYHCMNVMIYYKRRTKEWLGGFTEGDKYGILRDDEVSDFVEEWDLENLAEAWSDIHLP